MQTELPFENKHQIINLRPYQIDAVQKLRIGFSQGTKNQVLSLPTGAGKTIVAAFMLLEVYKKGKKAVFVCDRKALIDQTSVVLDFYGIPHGVIQGDHPRFQPYQRIQVASAQTLARRKWPETDLIIVDEAHSIHTTTKERLLQRDVFSIGLTATPFAKGMGKIYDNIVTGATLNQLTLKEKNLVPWRAFSPSEPDMTGAKISMGEWSDDEAEKRCLPIVGDCVTHYLRYGQGKKFICFGVKITHCRELQKQFMNAGIFVELYTSDEMDEAKSQRMEEFRKPNSKIRGLISVSALSRGLDVPDIEVVILARPLRKSLAEHIQMVGRGLRTSEETGKKECIILDHAGNMMRFYDDMMNFSENGCSELDDGRPKQKQKITKKEKKAIKCPVCFHIHDSARSCPACGYLYQTKTDIQHVGGELV